MINKHILISPPDGLSIPMELSPAVSAYLMVLWVTKQKHPASVLNELVEAALSGSTSDVAELHGEVLQALQANEDAFEQGIANLIQGVGK